MENQQENNLFQLDCTTDELLNKILPILKQNSINILKISIDLTSVPNRQELISALEPNKQGFDNEDYGDEDPIYDEDEPSMSLDLQNYMGPGGIDDLNEVMLPNDPYILSYYSRKKTTKDAPLLLISGTQKKLVLPTGQKKEKFRRISYSVLMKGGNLDFDQVLTICRSSHFHIKSKSCNVLLRGVKIKKGYDLVVYGKNENNIKEFQAFFDKCPLLSIKAFEIKTDAIQNDEDKAIEEYLKKELDEKIRPKIEKTELVFEFLVHTNSKTNMKVYNYFCRGHEKNLEAIKGKIEEKTTTIAILKIHSKSELSGIEKYLSELNHLSRKNGIYLILAKLSKAIALVKKYETSGLIEKIQLITKKKSIELPEIKLIYNSSFSCYEISQNFSQLLMVLYNSKIEQSSAQFSYFLDFKLEKQKHSDWEPFPIGEFFIVNPENIDYPYIAGIFPEPGKIEQILKLYIHNFWEKYSEGKRKFKDPKAHEKLCYLPIQSQDHIIKVLESFELLEMKSITEIDSNKEYTYYLLLYAIEGHPSLRYPCYLVNVNI